MLVILFLSLLTTPSLQSADMPSKAKFLELLKAQKEENKENTPPKNETTTDCEAKKKVNKVNMLYNKQFGMLAMLRELEREES